VAFQTSTDTLARLHENTWEDGFTRDISLELAHFSVGFIDSKGMNSDAMNIGSEVTKVQRRLLENEEV
jgi:hypothetical protein